MQHFGERFLTGDPTRMPWPQRQVAGINHYRTPITKTLADYGTRASTLLNGLAPTATNTYDPTKTRKAHPAGSIALGRTVNETLPMLHSCMGIHSALTVGQQNHGRFMDYPQCICSKCGKVADKHVLHATHLLLSTHFECLVAFEFTKDDKQVDIDGNATRMGDALIKLVTPINEAIFATSHPSFYMRNPSFCVGCLAMSNLSQGMFKALREEANSSPQMSGKVHFVQLPDPKHWRDEFTLPPYRATLHAAPRPATSRVWGESVGGHKDLSYEPTSSSRKPPATINKIFLLQRLHQNHSSYCGRTIQGYN